MNKILHSERKYKRVMGVDPSSFNIACSLIEKGEPSRSSKILLGSGEDIYRRIYLCRMYFPKILDLFSPDFVVIEQTIMIQNPETSRKLSYIVGVLMSEVLVRHIGLEDVPPATWKAFMGVKPLTKGRKESIISKLGEKDGKKEIQRLKKSQLQDILKQRFPNMPWEDTDVADSTGIGLWGFGKYGI